MREHSRSVGGRDQWREIIPIGCQTLNRSCRVDLFSCVQLHGRCTTMRRKDRDRSRRTKPLPVVTSRHPPFFLALLGFINDTDAGNYCCCSRTAWWPPQESAGRLIHPPVRVDRMNKTSTNMHFVTMWPRIPFFTPPSKPPIVQTRNSLLLV